MISDNLLENTQTKTPNQQVWQRCKNDINLYEDNIKQFDLNDTQFARNTVFDQQRTAPVRAQIDIIKQLPILRDEPLEHKMQFYHQIRAKDKEIAPIEGKAIHQLRSVTGLDPINIGSLGLGLNISSSDIDLGIGAPAMDDFADLCQALLLSGFEYKQTRDTRYISDQHITQRFVFSQQLDSLEVDVSLYHKQDLTLLADGGFECRRSMTTRDKAEHTWGKYKLKQRQMINEYALYKLEPYIVYKPGFRWLAIQV